MRPASARLPALILLAALGLAGSLRAGTATSITGLYTTGQESHVEEWWKNVDNHWTSSNSADKAYVLGFTPGGWATSSSAKWISASAVGYPGTSVDYSYSLVFNIAGTGTGAAGNASLTLTLYVDDSATILVNGVQTAVVSGSNLYANPTTVTLNSNFVIGSNTLSIVVNNTGGASGVMVSSISGAVPEVGTWLPPAVAFGAFCWIRMRRARHKLPAAV